MKTYDEKMLEMMQITLQKVLSKTTIEDQVNSKEKRNWELYNKLDPISTVLRECKLCFRIFQSRP
jgi:(p)ppGpp synthase/HD superfamily hydrolase